MNLFIVLSLFYKVYTSPYILPVIQICVQRTIEQPSLEKGSHPKLTPREEVANCIFWNLRDFCCTHGNRRPASTGLDGAPLRSNIRATHLGSSNTGSGIRGRHQIHNACLQGVLYGLSGKARWKCGPAWKGWHKVEKWMSGRGDSGKSGMAKSKKMDELVVDRHTGGDSCGH